MSGSVDIGRMNLRLQTRASGAGGGGQAEPAGQDREELKRMLRPLVLEILEELLTTELRVRGR